jgi:subtilisin family serine protease
MTDAADNFQDTISGAYIDFAAPGYDVYSTTIGGGYASGTGCSFAAPLVAGVVAWLFGLNPTLSPDNVIGILTNTAVQLGSPLYYGWGRIDFGAAAATAMGTLPEITSAQWSNATVVIAANYRPGVTCTLWRSAELAPPVWNQVANAILATNGAEIVLTDPSPAPATAFYRVKAALSGD